ncbi:MAG TPA: aminotransferase class V-fold PLP-dependent enzyme [Solirubrobacteraceae bacterium]|jgi:L-cysteine/cystine lyase|nr:aminotransferase class V-fold PLP-dependent enzyme [Solirubrobacteraceae bacterium]
MDATALRAEFPVLANLAYLNAGTDGPLPAAAVRAAAEELEREARDGRTWAHFQRRGELAAQLRDTYAELLHCATEDVALTTCTSEGMAHVIAGISLAEGDEILTSDEEHPGLLGPLAAARELRAVSVREVPLTRIAAEISERTRLVACPHVGWMSGALAPAELAQAPVPVLLDGAQGVGAVPTDVNALGCDAYAGAGQKWLCGPDGLGMLYVSPRLRAQLAVPRRGYGNLADANAGLDARLHEDARRFDSPALSAEALACAVAAVGVLARAGWHDVHARAAQLALRLAELLPAGGRDVAPRDHTTLVSFTSTDPERERQHLTESGCIVRNIPGRPWLRASVGAWNDEHDIDRLLAALFQ